MSDQLEIFEDNSSTRDALIDFAEGRINSVELEDECWPKEVKKLVRELRKRGVKKFRTLARRWCTKRGYDWKNDWRK